MASLELDNFEYANDGLSQAAYVTNSVSVVMDYMEYATDVLAQADYITNAVGVINQQQTDYSTGASSLGDQAGVEQRQAQSFKLPIGGNLTIDKVDFYFSANNGSPSGQVTLKIETDSAGQPSGTLVNANATKAITVTASDWNTFTFPASFDLVANTLYWIRLYCDNQTTDVRWTIGYKDGDPYPDGYPGRYLDGVWQDLSGGNYDRAFKVYTKSLQCYSESSIKTQGSYSLKGIATTSANGKTLTRTIGSPIDLTGIGSVSFSLYSSRTGSNIKIGIHDSGGTTTEITPNITSANAWQTISWNLSGVSDANKNAIDSIIVTIVDATSANTFYIDYFFASPFLQSYSEATIKTQGSYALKAVAAITSSLNKTLTKTATIGDLTGVKNLKFDMQASRTGSNIKIGIVDAGATTEITPNIITADTYQTVNWDISGVSDANKNAITAIVITLTNSDAANTFYIDNFQIAQAIDVFGIVG